MDALTRLVESLRCLPGVGPKSAQRMVHHLLLKQRERGLQLAASLEVAMRVVRQCERCNYFTEKPYCMYCEDMHRDKNLLCVVETPADVVAIEQSGVYHGRYFVLMGLVSPLDGVGPEDIYLSKLQQLVIQEDPTEVIIALTGSVEGQATTHFIQDILAAHPVKLSRLAHGIPLCGELEFLDGLTIGTALRHRRLVASE